MSLEANGGVGVRQARLFWRERLQLATRALWFLHTGTPIDEVPMHRCYWQADSLSSWGITTSILCEGQTLEVDPTVEGARDLMTKEGPDVSP